MPYLSLEHVESQTGRILKQTDPPVEDEGKSTTFRFDTRHVLYGKLRPYLNKVALPDFAGRCTTEMIPLLPADGVDRQFLAWLLRREETIDWALRQNTGARMPRADMDSLLTLSIPLPPLAEQERIAGRLTEQLAAVERARGAAQSRLAAAESLPAAYLREVFGPVAPFSAAPLMPKEGTRPGWRWHLLTDIARLATGHTPSRREPTWWGGDIQWLQLPDIRAVDGRRVTKTIEQTNPLGIANS
ncbi:MAG: restriction endonuclease subunit S, partial [bacterium]